MGRDRDRPRPACAARLQIDSVDVQPTQCVLRITWGLPLSRSFPRGIRFTPTDFPTLYAR